ncbi:MAG: rhamnogalacturonan acetylesterase [Myxococcota bacterium]
MISGCDARISGGDDAPLDGARVATEDGAIRPDAGSDRPTLDASSDSTASDAAVPESGRDSAATCEALSSSTLYLVGDSTVASDSGWGDALPDYLTGEAVVTNTAVGGRSSKSFYDEGRFDETRDALTDRDYVLIQFGHNDAKREAYRRTEPGAPPEFDGTYREYLERYIEETRARGATPVLVTSVSRMVFSDGLQRTHGDYPAAMRAVAADHGVTLLDLEERSFQEFDRLGEAETLRLYAESSDDRTHFPDDKAFRVAELVVELIRESPSSLACFLAE